MGMFSALTGGAIGAGMEFGAKNYLQNAAGKIQSALNQEMNQFDKEKMQNAYQWSVEDMKKAGLNPTLMFDSGGANIIGSSSGGSGVSAPSTNMTNSAIEGAKIASELGILNSQKENIDADTELKGKQAGKTDAEIEYQKTINKFAEAQQKMNLLLQNTQNKHEAQKIIETQNKIDAIKKDIAKTDAEIDKLKAEGRIAEAQAKTRENNRRAFAILEMSESITRSVGNVVGAVKGTSALPTHGNMNVNSNSNAVHWYGQ